MKIGVSEVIRVQLIELYLKNGKQDLAKQEIIPLLNNPTTQTDYFIQIKDAFVNNGLAQEIEEIFTQHVQDEINGARLRLVLGDYYLQQQDTLRSLSLYEQAFYLNPELDDLSKRLCDIYIASEKPDKAERLFDKLDIGRQMKIGRSFYFNNRNEEAMEVFQKIKKRYPLIIETYYWIGTINLLSSNYFEAIKNYSYGIKLDSTNAEFYYMLSRSYSSDNDLENALVNIKKSINLNPEDVRYLQFCADLYYNLNKLGEAEEAYCAVIKLDPDYHLALNNFSYMLAEQGRNLEDALKMSQKAVKSRPENSSYLDTLGWIYFKLGNYQTALECILEAIDFAEKINNSANSVLYDHIGDVYEKLGQKDNARSYWQKALELDENNETIRNKLTR